MFLAEKVSFKLSETPLEKVDKIAIDIKKKPLICLLEKLNVLVLSVPSWPWAFTLGPSQQVCSSKCASLSRGHKTLSYTKQRICMPPLATKHLPIINLKYAAIHMDEVHRISEGECRHENNDSISAGQDVLSKQTPVSSLH